MFVAGLNGLLIILTDSSKVCPYSRASVTCSIQNWNNGKRKGIQSNCVCIKYLDIARLLNYHSRKSFVKQAVEWWCVSVFKAGHGKDFLEPLLEAKKAGLKLALHLSEVKVFFILVLLCNSHFIKTLMKLNFTSACFEFLRPKQ